jgi:1-phosphatidylinositol-4-phosphate 5-kinase
MGHSGSKDLVPAAAPKESNSGKVSDIFGDARLLADYSEYLAKTGNTTALQVLRKYEVEATDVTPLELADSETLEEYTKQLQASWAAYRDAEIKTGHFADAKEWSQHALPHKSVIERLNADKNLVDEENEQYGFALAIMVGVNVATTCSRVIYDATSFGTAMQYGVRRYKVPAEGSHWSPKLAVSESFDIEEFSPDMFIQLRKKAGVSEQEYMDSLCRTDFHYIQFGSNSKSGEFFFFSHDMKYLIKTMAEDEAETLIDMLPDMNQRFAQEPDSMIGRYLGLYRIILTTEEGLVEKPRLFFIMCNTNRTSLHIDKTYDMKGSTRHRLSKPEESVGKDQNFDEDLGTLTLSPKVAADLCRIHRADVDLLLKYRIMDYSLLLQIHDNTKPPERTHPKVELLGGPAPTAQPYHDAETPGFGIKSYDGRYSYFFGLIDILVPYDTFPEPKYLGLSYPQAQYLGNNIITCGGADAASRVPPDYYRDRQVDMFEAMCGCGQE